MLTEIDLKTYREFFPADPHPFISPDFIELNRAKADKIVMLVEETYDVVTGMIAGIKDMVLKSPISAPFGGFHFRKENVYISEIERFLNSLKEYIVGHELVSAEITIPPDLYHPSFNAKTINSMVRMGFQQSTPEITNWIDLSSFSGTFTQKNSREYYRQSVRNGLSFSLVSDEGEKRVIYDLIAQNRAKFDRPIFMTYNDIIATGNLWPIDFFKVTTTEDIIVASGIFYRFHPEICYAVFWGDSDTGRPMRAMDFLSLNLWKHYKDLGYKYIDLGISTETGIPNEGLLRFKETHEAISSLRHRFCWPITRE